MFPITKAGAPYGAVEYVGDFTTDRYGKAAYIFSFVVEEAFDFNNETQVRKELSSVDFGRRPNDDGCLGAASPVTQFDGDACALAGLTQSSHLAAGWHLKFIIWIPAGVRLSRLFIVLASRRGLPASEPWTPDLSVDHVQDDAAHRNHSGCLLGDQCRRF